MVLAKIRHCQAYMFPLFFKILLDCEMQKSRNHILWHGTLLLSLIILK